MGLYEFEAEQKQIENNGEQRKWIDENDVIFRNNELKINVATANVMTFTEI